MSKLRSKPPANDTRPVRRSLVELTAAASRAVDDDALLTPVFPVAGAIKHTPRPEAEANAPAPTSAPKQVMDPHAEEQPQEPSSRGRAVLPETESTIEMLVQIAKDQHARTLEGVRLSVGAALNYAKEFAKTPVPAYRCAPDGDAKPQENLLAAAGAAAACRAEAIELAKAQAATTLDCARELIDATTAAEFIELASALARKQCEVMLKQTAALQGFARTVTKSGGKSDR